MPTNHDVVAALPAASEAVKTLLRDLLVKRMAYCLTSAAEAADLVAVDPASGATILVLILNGRLFALDAADTTTAHDGTSCLVTSDSKRYKLDDLEVPFAVLDKDLTAPPSSPSAAIGDAYLITGSGTGDWAGLGPLVVLTSRGWEEITLPVGRFVYVEDEDAYYHRKANGDIVAGLGIGSIAAGSLYPSHLLLGGGLVIWNVENQTETAPPASPGPSEGDTYIVAAGGTGDWSGWDGSIARYENGAWVEYEPSEGWRAFNKDESAVVTFDGTNWIEGVSTQSFTSSGTWTKPAIGTLATFLLWGGGGSGARSSGGNAGGGGGGAFHAVTIPLSRLPATVTVTVGAGGAARSSDQNGASGGVSRIAVSAVSIAEAYGGGGGSQATIAADGAGGGGGGGTASVGTIANPGVAGSMASAAPGAGGNAASSPTSGGSVAGVGDIAGGGAGGGAGGRQATDNATSGGAAIFGGGGGGGCGPGSGTVGSGGVSICGGSGGGGSRTTNATAGTSPGGGGGGCAGAFNSGAGGAGLVIVIVF